MLERRAPASLSPGERDELWSFFRAHCARTRREFEAALLDKDEAYVLRDHEGDVCGLSTARKGNGVLAGTPYAYVRVGMAAFDARHRGQSTLVRAPFGLVKQTLDEMPGREVYLISFVASAMVYLLLSNLLPALRPRAGRHTDPRVRAVLDIVGREEYGDRWDAPSGTVLLPPLYPEAASIPGGLGAEAPRFFRQRNPRHAEGGHLGCIARIEPADAPRLTGMLAP